MIELNFSIMKSTSFGVTIKLYPIGDKTSAINNLIDSSSNLPTSPNKFSLSLLSISIPFFK